MRLMYNTSDDESYSVSEILNVDQVADMRQVITDDEEEMMELSDEAVPGLIFTMQSVESLPAGECYYDTLYFFQAGSSVIDKRHKTLEKILKISSCGFLSLEPEEGIMVLNGEPQELRESIKKSFLM